MIAESRRDMAQIACADLLVAISCSPSKSRGGYHSELGAALALGLHVVLVGPRTNIFHWHHAVNHIECAGGDWIGAIHRAAQIISSVQAQTEESRRVVLTARAAIIQTMLAAKASRSHAPNSWTKEERIHLHRAIRHLLITLLIKHPKVAELASALACLNAAAQIIGCPDAQPEKACEANEDHLSEGLCRAAMALACEKARDI